MMDLCIVSYNAKDKLERMINTMDPSEREGLYRILVRDNNSTDGSSQYIREQLGQGRIDELTIGPNVGYAYACNELAMEGYNDIVALLNGDVWITRPQLLQVQQFFNSHPDVDIMGPKQRDERGYITHAGIFGPNNAPKHRGWKMRDPHDKLYRDIVDATTLSGAAYFVRREVWEELAGADEFQHIYDTVNKQTSRILNVPETDALGAFLPTPFYYEETFCSYYARHKGFKVVYNGEISIGHSWHGSVTTGSKMDQMFKVSRKMFRYACSSLGIEHD